METKETLLFIDDERDPSFIEKWHGIQIKKYAVHVVRSTEEAKRWVETNGHPSFISFDHDLGGDDTSMLFLAWYQEKWITDRELNPELPLCDYFVHSQNPVGALAIKRFMHNWNMHIYDGTFDKK